MSVNSNPSTASHESGSNGWSTTGCSLTCASLAVLNGTEARYAAQSPARHTAPPARPGEDREVRRTPPASVGRMALRWYTVVIDCHDIAAQARWWAETLDFQIVYEDEHEVAVIPKHMSEDVIDDGTTWMRQAQ